METVTSLSRRSGTSVEPNKPRRMNESSHVVGRIGKTLIVFVALLGLLSLAQFHIRKIVTEPMYYDDSFNANAPKNLAMGFGYSTSYHDIVPFDLDVTTGPVVLLPSAALIRLLGNQYWVPQLSITLSIWATLVLVLIVLRPYLTQSEFGLATTLIAFGLMLFPDGLGLLGEVPAALLACASLLVLCGIFQGMRTVMVAGLLVGLAIETKLIAALAMPSALAYLLFARVGVDRRFVHRVGHSMAFIGCALIPFALHRGWRFGAAGFSLRSWAAMASVEVNFVKHYSGLEDVQSAKSLSSFLLDRVAHNTSLLPGYFYGWLPIMLFAAGLTISIGAVVLMSPRVGRHPLQAPTLVVLGAATTHLMYWWLMSPQGWYRHLLPGTLYFLIGAVAAIITTLSLSRPIGMLAVLLLFFSWMPHFRKLKDVFNANFRPEPRLTALLATRNEMLKLQRNSDMVFVGYGYWVPRDLEYLLPSVGNFKDALRLQASDVAGKKIVLVRNEFFNWEGSTDERDFQVACDKRVLFTHHPFVISLCPGLPSELPIISGRAATHIVSGRGVLDLADCTNIAGWAWDSQQPDLAVKVDIFDGRVPLVTVLAYSFRQDLLNAGIGNGRHGFNYAPTATLKDGRTHLIRLKISGTETEISGTPIQFMCP
jgi:hypothetical protein